MGQQGVRVIVIRMSQHMVELELNWRRRLGLNGESCLFRQLDTTNPLPRRCIISERAHLTAYCQPLIASTDTCVENTLQPYAARIASPLL
jgi:hypothetical protein